MKSVEFLDWLRNYELLKKVSAPWIWLVIMVMIILDWLCKRLGRYCIGIIRQSGGTNCPLGAELFHADRQTHRHDDANRLCS